MVASHLAIFGGCCHHCILVRYHHWGLQLYLGGYQCWELNPSLVVVCVAVEVCPVVGNWLALGETVVFVGWHYGLEWGYTWEFEFIGVVVMFGS